MKRKFFRYKGIALNSSDIKKLLAKCFECVLGFKPPLDAITNLLPFVEGFPDYQEVFNIDFFVNGRRYEFNLNYPEFDAILILHSDQFVGSSPTLGFLDFWDITDFLDDLVKSRVDAKFEKIRRSE